MLIVGVEFVGDEGRPVALSLLDPLPGVGEGVLEGPLMRVVYGLFERGLHRAQGSH